MEQGVERLAVLLGFQVSLRTEVSVISEGNGCCISHSKGQKKQFEGLVLDIVFSVYYLVSI